MNNITLGLSFKRSYARLNDMMGLKDAYYMYKFYHFQGENKTSVSMFAFQNCHG